MARAELQFRQLRAAQGMNWDTMTEPERENFVTGLSDSNVKVTIDIEATFGDGMPEDLERSLTENCRTLRFNTQEFEDE